VDTDVLFVAGCEEQVKFHPQFDHIILLSAPVDVLTQRLANRPNNPFGKSPEEFRRFQADLREVEPLLRGNRRLRDRHHDAAQRGSAGDSEGRRCPATRVTAMLTVHPDRINRRRRT
jgi:hypothetical protein